ncbi:hypothetical protein LC608_31845 [Nostoc sp. XA010]|uniref:hypothetical protein n=1 Tax=Nostoc sp. XA010 TaxID=2780407 RepID=UPI001E28D078|nr:hypothetical protein [Nostoc sp. XA010]MCC5661467.1 hypothetical protein [Nostoc sp. XA010]
MATKEQLFTIITPEEGANISGGKAYELVIKRLYCVKAGADILGDDETKLLVNGSKLWGADMGAGSNKEFDPLLRVSVDNGEFVGLYDGDGIWSRDDSMGGFTINGLQEATTINLSGSGSQYTLTYKVIESSIF